MKTILISDVINNFGFLPPAAIPDHSILSGTFVTSFYETGRNFEQNGQENSEQPPLQSHPKSNKPPRKNLSKIDDNFLMGQETLELVLKTIYKLENIVNTKEEINVLWTDVKNIFLAEMSNLPDIPCSRNKKQNRKFRKSKPFWNEELESLWAKSCQAEKCYLQFKVIQNEDYPRKNLLRLNFRDTQKHFDKKYRYYKRQHRRKEYSDLESNAKTHPAAMWAALKRLNNPPTAKAALEIIREDKTVSHDLKEILERWYVDISGLFSGLNENPEMAFNEAFYNEILEKKREFEDMTSEEQGNQAEYESEELNEELSYDEVSDAVDKSKFKKSYLEIPNEALKNKNAKMLLHKFFNLCFLSGFNPSDWDFSDIVPIPKKDKDARDPLQNRCITIVCCVAKIYSSILNKRLQKYLEANKILAEEQNGFRVGRSCIDHIFVMCTVLRNRKMLGKETFLCFIDYKKAFDSVDRNLLLYKLSNIGVTGHMYSAISSLYSNPKSRVILQDYSTDYFDCPVGVKQGDCLSPTLFAIYINDLAKEIKNSGVGVGLNIDGSESNIETSLLSILLYADDIVLFAETELDLQFLLNIVEIWCEKWRLEVNLTKTNILHVRVKRKLQSKYMFLFNKRPVPYCTFYKYLGCNINEYLDYSFTAEMQADSAGQALSSIITKMIKNKGFPFSVYSILYQACVCSISQYGSEVFGYEQFDSTQKIHLRAARAFLGLPKNVASFGLVSELDWLLPHYQTQIKMIQHFGRVMRTNRCRLMYRVFQWDCQLNETLNINTWSSEIKSILYESNLNHVYDMQQIFPVKDVVSQLRLHLHKKQQDFLKNECESKPKLRTFITFKDFESLPPHVGKPLTFHERKLISKLRLGILPIRLETARYVRPVVPEAQRLCYCKSGDIETEFHVLFVCQMYENLRETWLTKLSKPDHFPQLTPQEKFKLVLNEPSNVRHTAQYLVNLMDLRRTLNDQYK